MTSCVNDVEYYCNIIGSSHAAKHYRIVKALTTGPCWEQRDVQSHSANCSSKNVENRKLSGRMKQWREREREWQIEGQILENNKIRTKLNEQKRTTGNTKNQFDSGLAMFKSNATEHHGWWWHWPAPSPTALCPLGGCVHSSGPGSSKGTNPLWFCAGWMQCCGRALVCSAPTLSILFHSCLAYISFPRQRVLKHFFRCLLWRQFLCGIFYDTKVSLYPSPLGQI